MFCGLSMTKKYSVFIDIHQRRFKNEEIRYQCNSRHLLPSTCSRVTFKEVFKGDI
jgi:hypothetical protein